MRAIWRAGCGRDCGDVRSLTAANLRLDGPATFGKGVHSIPVPSKNPNHMARYPQGAILRCTGCNLTGPTRVVTGHVARSKACHGVEIELVSVPPGTRYIMQPLAHGASVPAAEM